MGENIKFRDLTIDLERIFAILLVVIGHSLWFSRLKHNVTAQLMFHFFFFSVSLFFYISGYSLGFNLKYQKSPSLSDTLRKTTKKLVYPLIIWYFIYIFWTLLYTQLYPLVYGVDLNYTILDLFGSKYRGFHLWFIVALIFFYPLYSFLSQEERYRDNKYLIYSLVVSIIFTSLQYLQYYREEIMFLQYTPFPYTFFFVLGIWYNDKKQEIGQRSTKLWFKLLSVSVFLFGIILIVVETLYGPIGVSNVRFSIFIFTVGFILLSTVLKVTSHRFQYLQNLPLSQIRNISHYNFILILVKAIFGVYFIHVIILDILTMTFYLLGFELNSIFIISLIAILNAIVSFTCIVFLNQYRS